ncbi:MAG: hypothetical protein Q9190_003725 [Brigantiaea leucoxantha]
METCLSIIQHVENLTWKRAIAVFDNLKKNNLWKRVIKNVAATTIAGVAVNLVVNLCVFPEFSSSFLGQTAIETLHEARSALSDAGHYFTALHNSERNPGGETTQLNQTRGVETTHKHQLHKVEDFRDGVKAKLRAKLASCKAAQSECNFELFYGVLPPQDLKAISTRSMKKLVANTVAVIGACESKFALVGDDKDDRGEEAEMSSCNQGSDQKRKQSHFSVNFLTDPYKWSPKSGKSTAALDLGDSTDEAEKQEKIEIDLIKPRREIEFGDVRLLRYLLERIAGPYNSFAASIDRAVDCVTACVAYSYGVANLPSNTRTPRGIAREEIDIYVEEIRQALTKFDNESMSALEGAAELQEREGQQPDVMPREEIFLIASFLLNLRQAA